jgi:hypothetical protein
VRVHNPPPVVSTSRGRFYFSLTEYIEFASEDVSVSVWKGDVALKNVNLKKEFIQRLELPFTLVCIRLTLNAVRATNRCISFHVPRSRAG